MAIIGQNNRNKVPAQVAYREITQQDMQDPRLAGLNNLFLQTIQTVNALVGFNGTVVLNSGQQLNGDLNLDGNDVTDFATLSPSIAPTVTGSKGGNVALASLITALAGLGLIVDKTT